MGIADIHLQQPECKVKTMNRSHQPINGFEITTRLAGEPQQFHTAKRGDEVYTSKDMNYLIRKIKSAGNPRPAYHVGFFSPEEVAKRHAAAVERREAREASDGSPSQGTTPSSGKPESVADLAAEIKRQRALRRSLGEGRICYSEAYETLRARKIPGSQIN
mgnify:CR=1 FL=1|tara:strand:+ start:2342 stop:2824 length:483 start_codon:yes stop_codon:yes gene_type:complete